MSMVKLNRLRAILGFIAGHPLAGRHKLKAYTKFFGWQIKQFLFPRERIVPFIGSTCLSVKRGMAGATGNIYTGLHEFNDMGFLLHFLRPSDYFTDVGSNIGSYTILASGYIGATTIAFEPVPETFMQLQKNIRLNKIEKNVIAYNSGIGSAEGKLQFTSGQDTVNHVVTDPGQYNGKIIEVDITTLDTALAGYEIPALIKIDVEGFETEVMKGMNTILENRALKAIIIELNGSGGRYGYDENDIHGLLLKHGFVANTYDPFSRKLTNLAEHGSFNTIYIRDAEFVNKRLGSAPEVKIFSEVF